MIINAHNFEPPPSAFSPAVNGKMPIAAWIPSRDTAGNGTTTLTDLVGSNNGTLTNMDPATDWVADTGAGGVRALDFDGVNDVVTTGLTSGTITAFSASVWVRQNSLAVNKAILGWWSGSVGIFAQTSFSNSDRILIATGAGSQFSQTPIGSFAAAQWVHLAFTYSAAAPIVYINGALQTLTVNGAAASVNSGATGFQIGNVANLSRFWNGLIDDARIWNVALNATDVADLYAAGLGRGVDAS